MFAQKLKCARKAKGFTAQQMADRLQMSLRNYRNYESGHREPSLDMLIQIADYLDVSTDYLLCRDAFLTDHTVENG